MVSPRQTAVKARGATSGNARANPRAVDALVKVTASNSPRRKPPGKIGRRRDGGKHGLVRGNVLKGYARALERLRQVGERVARPKDEHSVARCIGALDKPRPQVRAVVDLGHVIGRDPMGRERRGSGGADGRDAQMPEAPQVERAPPQSRP